MTVSPAARASITLWVLAFISIFLLLFLPNVATAIPCESPAETYEPETPPQPPKLPGKCVPPLEPPNGGSGSGSGSGGSGGGDLGSCPANSVPSVITTAYKLLGREGKTLEGLCNGLHETHTSGKRLYWTLPIFYGSEHGGGSCWVTRNWCPNGHDYIPGDFNRSDMHCGQTDTPRGKIFQLVDTEIKELQCTCEGHLVGIDGQCVSEEDPDSGPPECSSGLSPSVGNPIHAGTGNKFERQTDFSIRSGLAFTRNYNSHVGASRQGSRMGTNWLHSYERKISGSAEGGTVTAYRGNGKSLSFSNASGTWVSAANAGLQLIEDSAGGWQLSVGSNRKEFYNEEGILTALQNERAQLTTLAYNIEVANGGDSDGSTLDLVTNQYGQTLSFSYDTAGRVSEITSPTGHVYQYTYDTAGNLIEVVYPDDTPEAGDNPRRIYHYEDTRFPNALTGITHETGLRYSTFIYDELGRAISSDHGNGVDQTSLVYNEDGSTTVSKSNGSVSTYQFEKINGSQKVVAIEGDPCSSCGTNTAASYDSNGFANSVTDGNGNVTQFTRDETGLELTRIEAVGSSAQRTITTTWQLDIRAPLTINEPGKQTGFSYDSYGRLISRIELDMDSGEQREVRYSYSDAGLLLAMSEGPEAAARVTTYEYDAQDNLIRTTNALGQVSELTRYDSAGRLLEFSDANGLVTELNYDARGRLIASIESGSATYYTLDAVGNIERITLPDNSFISYEYDSAHRVIAVSDAEGNRIEYTLDNEGNRVQQNTLDQSGRLTRKQSSVFDALNRMTAAIGADGATTHYQYDANDNQTSVTNPLDNITSSAFDALNRIVSSTDAANGVSLFEYNALDQLVKVTDPNGNETTYQYNAFGDKVQQNSPDTGATTYSYNAFGERVSQTNAEGVTTQYHYDALGRLVTVVYPNTAENITYGYDTCANGVGRLCELQDESGIATFNYDVKGNTTQVTKVNSGGLQASDYITEYAYDAANNISSITYPSGLVAEYSYDANGSVQAINITQAGENYSIVNNVSYLPFGPIASISYGNGVEETRIFNEDYRLISQTIGNAVQRNYQYDSAGRIVNITEGDAASTYEYDSVDRLTYESGGYGYRQFEYDANGNRIFREKLDYKEQESGVTEKLRKHEYSYVDGGNQLAAITRIKDNGNLAANSHQRAYDSNGNTISRNKHSFVYNQAERLVEVYKKNQLVANYTYNGFGQRAIRTKHKSDNDIRTVHYHYNQSGQMLGQTRYNNAGILKVNKDIIWLDNMPVAQLITRYKKSGDIKRTELVYIHTDHLNTPRYATDSEQGVVWEWASDAFGVGKVNTDPDGDGKKTFIPLRFPGQINSDAGLYYNYFRDYEPSSGRYIQSDPIGLLAGLNTYGYVSSSPLLKYDMYGLFEGCIPHASGGMSCDSGPDFGSGDASVFSKDSNTQCGVVCDEIASSKCSAAGAPSSIDARNIASKGAVLNAVASFAVCYFSELKACKAKNDACKECD